MNKKEYPKDSLLVISRGRFSRRDNEFVFQIGDGYYLDRISTFFKETTIVSREIPMSRITNETFVFENEVQFLNRDFYSNYKLISRCGSLVKLIRKNDIIYLFIP